MDKSDIWKAMHAIEDARRQKMKELIREYDEQIYYPERRRLQQECRKLGHGSINYHDNGLGYTFHFCNNCGADIKRDAEQENQR